MILEVLQGEYLLRIGSLCEGHLCQLRNAVRTHTPEAGLLDFRAYLGQQEKSALLFAYGNDLNCQIPTEPFALGWSAEKVQDCCGERPALEAVAAALLYQQKTEKASLSLTPKTLRTLEYRLFQFHWQLALTLTAQLLVDTEAPRAETLRALAELTAPTLCAGTEKVPALRELFPYTKQKEVPKGFQKMLGHLNRILSTSSADLLKDTRDNTYTYRKILYDVFFQIKKAEECTFSAAANQLPTGLLMDQIGRLIDAKYITRYSLLAVLWDLLPPGSPTPFQIDALKWHGFKKTAADSALKKTVPEHGEPFFIIQTLSGSSICTLERKTTAALSPLPNWWCRPGSTAAAYSNAMQQAQQKQKAAEETAAKPAKEPGKTNRKMKQKTD